MHNVDMHTRRRRTHTSVGTGRCEGCAITALFFPLHAFPSLPSLSPSSLLAQSPLARVRSSSRPFVRSAGAPCSSDFDTIHTVVYLHRIYLHKGKPQPHTYTHLLHTYHGMALWFLRLFRPAPRQLTPQMMDRPVLPLPWTTSGPAHVSGSWCLTRKVEGRGRDERTALLRL